MLNLYKKNRPKGSDGENGSYVGGMNP